MLIKTLIPSMFVRRILLLAGAAIVVASPLVVQLGRLTIVRGDQLRADAESRLIRRQWTPTIRGSILDRKGRVLAQDRPSYDCQVPFSVITGDWAAEQASIAARRTYGQTGWLGLNPQQRTDATDAWLAAYQVHLESGWNALAATLGLRREEVDLRRDAIVARVNDQQAILVRRRTQNELEQAKARNEPLTPELSKAIERRANLPIAEFKAHHTIAARIGDDLAFAAGNLGAEEVIPTTPEVLTSEGPASTAARPVGRLPGLRILDSGDRDYPYEALEIAVDRSTLPTPLRYDTELVVPVEGVACHIIGRLRDNIHGDGSITSADGTVVQMPGDAAKRREFLAANPATARAALTPDGKDRGGYRDGDRVGETGVEGANEHHFRGLRGSATTHLDTGLKDYIPAVPGNNISLTIDIMLQARIQAAMSREVGLAVVQPWHLQESETQPEGAPLFGAAVVLDVDSAQILAAVSTPTFTRNQLSTAPHTVFDDELTTPYINRCWQRPYPPGSIAKAAVLAGAISYGNLQPDERIACNGYLIPDRPDVYRCLIYKRYHTTHSILLNHDPDGIEALTVSCNIFFYTLGRRMGADSLVRLYRSFGVGAPFDLGAGSEYPGQLGQPGTPLQPPDAIQMSIGQGPVAWTPLHAADMYATIARAGARTIPTLLSGAPQQTSDLGLNLRAIQMSMKGLELAINGERGTGRTLTFDGQQEPIFNAPGVRIWGKTGTATASDLRAKDPDGSGPLRGEVLEKGDHSWFVILAGRDRPRYAIAVVIDYGGSGGKVSGPIANQIVHALIAEGYL